MDLDKLKRILCWLLYIYGICVTFMGGITVYTTGLYLVNLDIIVVGCAMIVIGILLICCGTLVEDRIYDGEL